MSTIPRTHHTWVDRLAPIGLACGFALLLVAGTFNLTMWLFGALLALFGFLSSIKATTERTTAWWLRRSKALRLKRQMAAQAALASMPVQG